MTASLSSFPPATCPPPLLLFSLPRNLTTFRLFSLLLHTSSEREKHFTLTSQTLEEAVSATSRMSLLTCSGMAVCWRYSVVSAVGERHFLSSLPFFFALAYHPHSAYVFCPLLSLVTWTGALLRTA